MGEPMVTEKRPVVLEKPALEDAEGGCSHVGDDEKLHTPQRRYWRSASWSSSHSAPPSPGSGIPRAVPYDNASTSYPLTPRPQQSNRIRPTLPPLQPVGRAGNDDGKEWAPLTPRRDTNRMKNGLEIKLDLAAVQRCRDSSEPTEMQMKRDKFAYFDKECSRVAEHIYLGSDAVARNRETLLANKITHVLNCVGFICKEYFREDFKYNTLWLQDSPSEDITSILYDVFDYFEEVRESGGRVFVHCCQGVSRSTALVIAYLMWREGRSFEDAFQDVKAARGITNPNMGFACQLLQAQKRVHASPASPNSVLRMYRMAPHSSYDALHLVPKTVNNPSPGALDSRGAFVVHVPSTIFVWVGRSCETGMEMLARAAAGQVVRYERAQAPVVCIRENEEPSEFWEAFSKGSNQYEVHARNISEGEYGNGRSKSNDSGTRQVGAYDLDFELYQRALHGGVVPPSGAVATHVPARVSGWSRLRKKVFSGSVREMVASDCPSAARGSKESESCYRKEQSSTEGSEDCKQCDKVDTPDNSVSCDPQSPLSVGSTPSSSPPMSNCPSPSCSLSRSPTPSPSSSYSWSPISSDDSSVSSPYASPLLRFPPLLNPKGSFLAERRGCLSPPLFLGTTVDEPPPTPRFGKSFASSFKQDAAGSEFEADEKEEMAGLANGHTCLDVSATSAGSDHCAGLMEIDNLSQIKSSEKAAKERKIYEWPRMEKVDMFDRRDLKSGRVFLLVDGTAHVFIWVGSSVKEAESPDWQQIATNFLKRVKLQIDIPVLVVEEGQEPKEFWELFH